MKIPPPHEDLRASVVVPARNEEALIEACLDALAGQEGVGATEYEVLLVLDACEDETGARAREVAARRPDLTLHLLEGPGRGAGHARRVGMEEACARLLSVGRSGGLVASTDADTVVAPDWLRLQLDAAADGARAIGGRIELRDDEDLARGVGEWRAERGRKRHLELLADRPPTDAAGAAEHWQFSGASLALTAEAYAEVGGLEPRAALEDEYLERALERCGIPIQRPLAVRVQTSARTIGRASRGLARDLALASWVQQNTFDSRELDPSVLLERKRASGATVSVILPMDDKGTSALLESLAPLTDAGLVDEKIVLCGETKGFSPGRGARAYADAELLPRYGPVRGYGDSLWRGLSVSTGEIVLFLDPTVPDPEGRRAVGLLGPLLLRDELRLVKGFSPPSGGAGRALSELAARPLINLYKPELAGFVDPLSCELAARRGLLESLPFPVGYGASLSLLLDALRETGTEALAQVRLDERPETEVPLADLSEAAYAALTAAMSRIDEDALREHSPGPLFLPTAGLRTVGLGQRRVAVEERPPLKNLPPSAIGESNGARPGSESRYRAAYDA